MPTSPGQGPFSVRRATGDADRQAAFAIRTLVFVEEQGVPAELELDELDATAIHVVAETDAETAVHQGGRVVGTGRLVVEGGDAQIGRIAVLPEWRRRGVAGLVIATLEHEAAGLGYATVALHAQRYIQPLYDMHGYRVTGPPFIEAGIDHVPMMKRLR